MRRNPRLFRLTATVALTALLWDALLPLAAVAQPAPPPLPPLGQGQPDLTRPDPNQADPNRADLDQADPPARVGRIAGMTGTVSFHNDGDTDWSAASLNYPVSSGNAFWTEPSAGAQLEIADSRVVLAGGTEFDLTTLDGNGLQSVVPQGQTYIRLRDLAPNEAWSIQTPRGLVRLAGQGRYEIVAGTTEQPTLLTVIDGAAQIDGPGVSLQVAAGQTATIIGTDSLQGSIGPALRDAFLTASLNADRPPARPTSPIPPQVIAMAGGSDLVGTGSWADAPEYGQVWYPPVAEGWVPYREGHWAYVAPWGWTWIDDAPWGFAPFHYGRWIEIGGRWAWTPGGVAVAGPPVYAPALVTFIGIGAGVALGAALASGSIGWVPLGPRESFRPWYHASPRYVREVNTAHVRNINAAPALSSYVNRGAATSIPAAAMTGSRPVQGMARPVTAQQFAAARPIVGQQPLRPTAATAGVTPAVARRLDLAPVGGLRPAPGPAVRPVAGGTAGFARPAFPSAGNRPAPATLQTGRPEARTAASAQPEARPAAPARPEAFARPAAPAQPETRPATPARPETLARPAAPAQPGARPASPARPDAFTRPAAPAQPEARPAAPVRPETFARPAAPAQLEARPAVPARPEAFARPVAPARPQAIAPPAAAARPAAPPRPEARPEAVARPAAAARPEARPAAPARPAPQADQRPH